MIFTFLGFTHEETRADPPPTQTEVDTTVFGSTKIQTDGLGRTTGQGKNQVSMVAGVQALSGETLPQATAGGELTGTFHAVTSDGCGPIQAVLDPTATGKFSDGTLLTTTADVPGTKGQCPRAITKKSYVRDLLERSGVITRRATNVNKDFEVKFTLPADAACQGSVNGLDNVCLVKIANNNNAGPFGGVIPIQIGGAAAGNASATPATPAAAAPAAAGAAGAATGAAKGAAAAARREIQFTA